VKGAGFITADSFRLVLEGDGDSIGLNPRIVFISFSLRND
jgi:hypothetical protein